MMHPDTELKWVNGRVGHGVFATRDIPMGSMTWVRDKLDISLTLEQFEALEEPYQKTFERFYFKDDRGMHVLCWDHARYINHCCDANCLSVRDDVEIAVRDIFAGEQLTDDYATFNLMLPFRCECDSPMCRGDVRPKDPSMMRKAWDGRISVAAQKMGSVDQPLLSIANDTCQGILANWRVGLISRSAIAILGGMAGGGKRTVG